VPDVVHVAGVEIVEPLDLLRQELLESHQLAGGHGFPRLAQIGNLRLHALDVAHDGEPQLHDPRLDVLSELAGVETGFLLLQQVLHQPSEELEKLELAGDDLPLEDDLVLTHRPLEILIEIADLRPHGLDLAQQVLCGAHQARGRRLLGSRLPVGAELALFHPLAAASRGQVDPDYLGRGVGPGLLLPRDEHRGHHQ